MESLRQEPDIIDVKTAVQTALGYVRELYGFNEKIRDLGLEEVELETDYFSDTPIWSVTVGFARPWSKERVEANPWSPMATAPFKPRYPIERDYKRVRIDAKSGEVIGMEIREL